MTFETGTWTYNGAEQKPTVTVTGMTSIILQQSGNSFTTGTLTEGTDYTVTYADNVKAGTATITVTGKRFNEITIGAVMVGGGVYDNYSITRNPGKLTIKPKPVTATVTSVDREYIAGNTTVTLAAGTVSDVIDGDAVTLDVSEATGTMADADAGENKPVTVTGVKLGDASAGNYALSEQPMGVTVTINKANAVAATVTANNRAFDGTEQPLVTVDDSTLVGGEMRYARGTAAEATESYAASIPKAVDAGTHYVWYKVVGDENHNDSEAACVTVTVAEAPPKPEPEPEPQPQPEPEPEPQTEPQPPRGLYITPGSVAPIQVKETVRLTAASDTGLSLKKVKWGTSDKKVATVKNGVVTGKKAGTATITASVDQLSASIDIVVEDKTIPTGVHFADGTPKGFELADGIDLAPFVVLEPDTAVTKLKWSTSDKKVAPVKNGKVSGKTGGTVVITATTANDFSASIELTVKDSSAPTEVWFAEGAPTLVEVDDSIDLAPFVVLAPDTAWTKLTWSTSDKKTASVRNGKVTGKNGSTVTITATTANGLSASIEITVKDTAAPTAVHIEAPPARPLGVKEKLQLNVTFEPADVKPKKIKWTSSNKKVATVNDKGEVTGKGQGTATITTTARNVSASVEIVVVDYTMPTKIEFIEGVPTSVEVKGEIDLKPFVRMEPDTAKSKLTWTTSDKKIATVKKGTVTGKAPGTAWITVAPARNKSLSAMIEVTVVAAE